MSEITESFEALMHPEGTMCNVANKLYTLRTQLKSASDVAIELCKAKIMSKGIFNFDNYAAAFASIPQPMTDPGQKQFKLGLTAYCQDRCRQSG